MCLSVLGSIYLPRMEFSILAIIKTIYYEICVASATVHSTYVYPSVVVQTYSHQPMFKEPLPCL